LAFTLLLPGLNPVRAETIEFPDEELATESVLPVFDKTVVVRERTVKTAKRFEVGGGAGLSLVEPLYEQMVFNITASYHFDELHGVNVSGVLLSDGLSNAGSDLKAGKGLENSTPFDASLAPTIQSMLFANYQFSAYYGKISLTKQKTMNLSLYGTVGGGIVNWSDTTTFGLDAGIGQKIYFTPNVGLRIDLMLAMYTGPDPTSPKTSNGQLNSTSGSLGSDQFESTFYFRPFLTGAFVVLF
jgi:outer membrane beta-barrel protein